MLQAFQLSYEPGPTSGPLFEDLSLSVRKGEIVCLIGPNGAGKTALLELLAGIRTPGRGKVVLESGSALAYVPQDVDPSVEGTLEEILFSDTGERVNPKRSEGPANASPLIAGPDACSGRLRPGPSLRFGMTRLASGEEKDSGLAEARARLKRNLARLGIPPERLSEPASVFSIGERVRAEIARALLSEPDILLLDEPTNHLDSEGRGQLIRFLKSWDGACLMVCHDRTVIDAVADRTFELARGRLTEYTGGYTEARLIKDQTEARLREQYEKSRTEERRLKIATERTLQKAASMVGRPTNRTYDPKAAPFYAAKEAKLARRAHAIRKQATREAERRDEKPFEPDSVVLRFAAKPLRHSEVLCVRGLRHAFEGRELFDGLSLTLQRGSRIALMGPNGSGKTTLFRILLGEITPNSGTLNWAPGAAAAYLTQGRERLEPDLSVVKAIGGDEPTVRTLLACLGLRNMAAEKPVGVLSVGERTKAELVGLLCSPANVLLLDEPTNHLDLPALEALEEALLAFPGSVIFASHDLAFVERAATEVIRLGMGEDE